MPKRTPEEEQAIAVSRKQYQMRRAMCEVCGERPPAQIHELSGGSSRALELEHHECFLAVCFPCHNAIHLESASWPKPRMVAIKLMRTLDVINRCRVGRGLICKEDVLDWMATE